MGSVFAISGAHLKALIWFKNKFINTASKSSKVRLMYVTWDAEQVGEQRRHFPSSIFEDIGQSRKWFCPNWQCSQQITEQQDSTEFSTGYEG